MKSTGPVSVEPLAYECPRVGGGRYVTRVCAAAMFLAALTRLVRFGNDLTVWLATGISLYTAHWANALLLYKEFAGAGVALFMLVAAIGWWRGGRGGGGGSGRRDRLALWAAAAWVALSAADVLGILSIQYRGGLLDRSGREILRFALTLSGDEGLHLLLAIVVLLLARHATRTAD